MTSSDFVTTLEIGERGFGTGRPDPGGILYLATMSASVNLGDATVASRRIGRGGWPKDIAMPM